ncbi:hypothetical protein BH24BAC1_BH24BAC1_19320 [soil metagenome]
MIYYAKHVDHRTTSTHPFSSFPVRPSSRL